MFITNITKSSQNRFRQAIFSKVLLHLNDITTLLERHTGPFEGILEHRGRVQKIFDIWPSPQYLNIYPKSSLL